MRHPRFILPTASLVMLASLSAAAQSGPAWLSDRRYAEGAGIKVGELQLHPGIAAELGFDSNYFRRSGDNYVNGAGDSIGTDAPIVDIWRLRVTPSLSVANYASRSRAAGDSARVPKLKFHARTFASYNEFLHAGGDTNDPVDLGEQRSLDLGVGGKLDILPDRPWGADVSGDFVRSAEPSNLSYRQLGWDRDMLALGAGVSWRPLGGVLRWRLGYDFRYNWFESSLVRLDNSNHAIDTRGSFRFLPRTAFIYDARYAWLRYTYAGSGQNDGESVRSRIGVNSLFTNRFSVLAMVGWATSFYDQRENPLVHNHDGVTATGELRYYVDPDAKMKAGEPAVGFSAVTAGVTRDYENSYLADYLARTRGYLGLSYFLGGYVLLDAEAGYSHLQHPPFEARGATFDPPNEHRVDARLFGEYRILPTLGLNATLKYDASLRDVVIQMPADPAAGSGAALPFADNLAYTRFQAWVGARWLL